MVNKKILLLPYFNLYSNNINLIAESEKMRQVVFKAKQYSKSEAPVLITGETGTGKECVASIIYKHSNRNGMPFVCMNCSAVSDSLFESEMFGYEKGAFSDALKTHRGRFERADGGVLFLDEIGDLSRSSQAKLLRALESSTIERVGGDHSIKINVRVIAATNHNLEKESMSGLFRSDLFYRLNTLSIEIPPLRERLDDVEPLIKNFVDILNKKYNKNIVYPSKKIILFLQQYNWPGNVRELKNLMIRLFAEKQNSVIDLEDLRDWYEEKKLVFQQYSILNYQKTFAYNRVAIPLAFNDEYNTNPNKKRKRITKEELIEAFIVSKGNIRNASKVLGVFKDTFYRRMKEYGLTRESLHAYLKKVGNND